MLRSLRTMKPGFNEPYVTFRLSKVDSAFNSTVGGSAIAR
jgi:hypothetical protein